MKHELVAPDAELGLEQDSELLLRDGFGSPPIRPLDPLQGLEGRTRGTRSVRDGGTILTMSDSQGGLGGDPLGAAEGRLEQSWRFIPQSYTTRHTLLFYELHRINTSLTYKQQKKPKASHGIA